MEITQIETILGLASNAVGITGTAATTADSIKKLFSKGENNSDEAKQLLNELLTQLTSANITNVQLSESLKGISEEFRRLDSFQTEKAKYEKFMTPQNAMVYRLKDGSEEPMHFICPVCLNTNQFISFLDGTGTYRKCQLDRNHFFQFEDTNRPRHKTIGVF